MGYMDEIIAAAGLWIFIGLFVAGAVNRLMVRRHIATMTSRVFRTAVIIWPLLIVVGLWGALFRPSVDEPYTGADRRKAHRRRCH